MTPPSVLVNTYLSASDKPYIDPISKIFIISKLAFGIIRLPLLGDVHVGFIILSAIYSLMLALLYALVLYTLYNVELLGIIVYIFYLQCIFFMIFNVVSIKRMQRYYNELNVFDKEVGCRPRIGKASINNLMLTIVMIIYVVFVFALPFIFVSLENLHLGIMPFPIIHILEVTFCGHLLSLLLPRLRLINYYMELSLSNTKLTKTLNIEQFGYSKADSNKTLCKMDKVMNLYHNMIKSYNYLIESVKWQLLVTIVSAFLNILSCCYRVSLTIIKEDCFLPIAFLNASCHAVFDRSDEKLVLAMYGIQVPLTFMITYVGLLAGIMFPLFSPCMLGDKVHNEVRRLRELLASRLYENQLEKREGRCYTSKIHTSVILDHVYKHENLPLPVEFLRIISRGPLFGFLDVELNIVSNFSDKASRGMARALLAWTETRDLSFSLLRMLNIDISLPFKFVGLLVTYLIILLQFQKVINP